MALKEFEVGEVCDPGETDDGYPYRAPGCLPSLVPERERVLAWERDICVRDHPEHPDACEFLEFLHPGREEPDIPPELVDDDPDDERPDIIGEEGERPVDLGEDPAPFDIGDENDRKPEAPGEPDVCDVAVVEVHLRRSPGPFHHYVPKASPQPLKRLHRCCKERIGLGVVVLDRTSYTAGRASPPVRSMSLRFEEDRVHIGHRLDTRGEGRTAWAIPISLPSAVT